MPPRVLMVAADFPPQLGGVATYSLALARTLHDAGIDLAVVTSVPGAGTSGDGPPVSRVAMGMNRKYLKILPLLAGTFARCLRRRPDLLVLMKCNHEGVAGAVCSRLFGIPYVVAAYGSEVLSFRRNALFGRFMARLFRNATRVLVDSEYAKGLVADCGVSPGQITVVHPGLEPVEDAVPTGGEAFRRQHGLQGKRLLLTVSRLVERKGHDKVVEALAMLRDDYPDVVWVVVGDGPHRRTIEDLAARHGVSDRILMLGRRPAGQVDLLYRISECFVMPSRQQGIDVEGFGIAFVEAALRRLPSIAGRHGGVPEAVGDEESGLLVDPYDARDVARGIRGLLDDPALARKLGEQGRERAMRKFGRDRQLDRLRELFLTLTSPSSPPEAVAIAEGGRA